MSGKDAVVGQIVRDHAPLLVAYSGGVDSACLLALAHRAAPGRVTGVIADSPSLPREALADALEQASGIGVTVKVLKTSEFEDERYLANPPDRCYFCKAELFQRMEDMARCGGYRALAYGENADDAPGLRPGSRAAQEFSVISPLRAAGMTKADVRETARRLGLPAHDAPAAPCLSSRIPHGVRVTREALALVEAGEAFVRRFGFRVFRVRYIPGPPVLARLQVAPDEMDVLRGNEEDVRSGLLGVGFEAVEIDPLGYR